MRVLICMPTYNEVDNLGLIAPAIFAILPHAHLLIIDDASPDGTGRLADQLAARDDRVHVLHRARKQGLGPAYSEGFRWGIARQYDALIEMDADFSHPPRYLPALLAQLERHDVVVGSRYVPGGATQDWGLVRRLVSRGGGLYARAVLGLSVRDLTAGFVAWRREALELIDLDAVEASGYVFQIELKHRAILRGLSLREVPIHFPDRARGASKMTPQIAAQALWRVWRIRLKSR